MNDNNNDCKTSGFTFRGPQCRTYRGRLVIFTAQCSA